MARELCNSLSFVKTNFSKLFRPPKIRSYQDPHEKNSKLWRPFAIREFPIFLSYSDPQKFGVTKRISCEDPCEKNSKLWRPSAIREFLAFSNFSKLFRPPKIRSYQEDKLWRPPWEKFEVVKAFCNLEVKLWRPPVRKKISSPGKGN